MRRFLCQPRHNWLSQLFTQIIRAYLNYSDTCSLVTLRTNMRRPAGRLVQLQKPPRPTGITIVAILAILIGIFGLLAGIAIIGLSALVSTSTLLGTAGGVLSGLGLILGAIVAVFSLIWLAVGFGFLHGKGWAWTLGMIFSVLSIIGALGFMATGSYTSIVGVFVWGLMIYYLTRTGVKSFFGKGPGLGVPAYSTTPAFPAPSTPSFASPMTASPTGITASFGAANAPTQSLNASSNAPRFCTNCGATITPGAAKCESCGRPF